MNEDRLRAVSTDKQASPFKTAKMTARHSISD